MNILLPVYYLPSHVLLLPPLFLSFYCQLSYELIGVMYNDLDTWHKCTHKLYQTVMLYIIHHHC